LRKSASLKPAARNIARDGVCFTPSTTRRDQRRGSTAAGRGLLADFGVFEDFAAREAREVDLRFLMM
jgi:hypothetical protein